MSETIPVNTPGHQHGRLWEAAMRQPAPNEALRPSRLLRATQVLGPAVIAAETGGSNTNSNDHAERVFPGQEDRMVNPYFNRRGR